MRQTTRFHLPYLPSGSKIFYQPLPQVVILPSDYNKDFPLEAESWKRLTSARPDYVRLVPQMKDGYPSGVKEKGALAVQTLFYWCLESLVICWGTCTGAGVELPELQARETNHNRLAVFSRRWDVGKDIVSC